MTRKNAETELKLDLNYQDSSTYDMTITNIFVFNDNEFTATVTPIGNSYVYIDNDTPKNEEVSITTSKAMAVLCIARGVDYVPPSESAHLTAKVSITSNAQDLPRKIIKIEKGPFYEGSTDLSPTPEEPDTPGPDESKVEPQESKESETNNDENDKGGIDHPEDSDLTGGEIAGIAIGCVAGVAIIGFCIVWFAVLKKGVTCNNRVSSWIAWIPILFLVKLFIHITIKKIYVKHKNESTYYVT